MTPETRRELDLYLEQVIDLPENEWAGALDGLCPDAGLRAQVLAMLARTGAVGTRLSEVIEATSRQLLAARPYERLGPYRLVRELGAGGMGAVWLAEREDGQFQQQVAIKVLRTAFSGQAMHERFRQERQILARLRHPHIAQLLDGGSTEDGAPYLVMEYVDGPELARHAAGLGLRDKLRLFLQVCDAVEYAHRRLVVHRDLKMANILVTAEGAIKLLDFGIARVLEEAPGFGDTVTHLMTPEYASPEQLSGQPVTTLSDVYSLGMVLYVLLTGASPYRAGLKSSGELMEAILTQPVAAPSAMGRALPSDLDVIALKALRKEPERRYQSVAELGGDVRSFLEGRPISARPDSWSYRAGKFVARNPYAVAAFTCAALALGAFAITTAVQSRRLEGERDRARRERDNAQWLARFLTGVFRISDPREGAGEKVTARELLDRGARQVEGGSGNPELRSLMGAVISRAYFGLGLLRPAEKSALESYAAARTPDARREVLRVLEEIYLELAQPDELLRYALEHEQLAGPGASKERAMALSAQGSAFGEKRKYEEARARHASALQMLVRIGEGNSTEAGIVLNNAANVEYNNGSAHFPQSMAFARRAVAILRRTGPAEELMSALNSVAVVAMTTHDFATAEPYGLEGLALARSMYGERHLNLALNYNNLCGLYTLMKRPTDALGYCRLAVELRREGYPAGHRLIGISLNNLGKALLDLQRWQEAETAFREGYTILEHETGGPPARSAEGIAQALRGKRDWAGSAQFFREALQRWTRLGTKNVDDLRRELAAVEAHR